MSICGGCMPICGGCMPICGCCMPISIPFIHPFLMNSYWHQVGTLQ
jgi:hypothetical protein